MTEKEQLLGAVLDAPGEDTVRLAYADFLDETGDPDRAELIRWQISTGVAYAHSRYGWREAAKKATAAVPAGARRALDELLFEPVPRSFIVRRGFIDVIRPAGDELVASAQVFRAHPVARVDVSGYRPFASTVRLGSYVWSRRYVPSQDPEEVRPATLPSAVFDRLADYCEKYQNLRYYHSIKAANAALNRAVFDIGMDLRATARAWAV